jgi:hypothetical protein
MKMTMTRKVEMFEDHASYYRRHRELYYKGLNPEGYPIYPVPENDSPKHWNIVYWTEET